MMTENDLKGMTVNERLFILGLMDKFDRAIRKRDSEASIKVLIEALFTVEQAKETVISILEDPEHYGF